MKHLDDDTIYNLFLELLDDSESAKAKAHIKHCEECANNFQKISNQINFIGSYNPIIENDYNPLKKDTSSHFLWLKRAAIIILGVFLGYSASDFIEDEEIIIVGQRLVPKHSLVDTLKYIECPNVDIYIID